MNYSINAEIIEDVFAEYKIEAYYNIIQIIANLFIILNVKCLP